ncbi:hypothetical protein Psi02_13350 [Planotetraspora silvatica]|uniref:Uncharacterized protein n=1 Tax=Planotetraspora silvatica TaxID=234614 RepID=A0A8J3UKG5_9ACTN|nr:hypothetical protein Psi02_13350 [Planotetraspora silvatica]
MTARHIYSADLPRRQRQICHEGGGRSATPESWPRRANGIVLYAGQETLPFGDRMRALPLSALWEAAADT